MPQSIPDFSPQINTLERKLRTLKRNIIGTAATDEEAISDPNQVCLFEAELDAAIGEWERFQRAWDELENVYDQASMDFPSRNLQEMYDAVRKEIIKAKSHRITIERSRSQLAAHPAQAYGHQSFNTSFVASARAHLPKIPLPLFSGDLLKWMHFKDTFISMVHDEPTLSNVEKFHYLLGALRGEAATLIPRFPVEDKSYHHAWRKLFENYDNPRVLASLFIQKIIDCDLKGARNGMHRYDRFLVEVADSIEGFKSLALQDAEEFILASLALRALDSSTRRNFEISRTSSSIFPTADEVITFVRQRKTAIAMSRDFLSSSNSNEELPKGSQQHRFPARTARKYNAVALHSSSSAAKKYNGRRSPPLRTNISTRQAAEDRRPPACPFCQDVHLLPHCFKFSNLPLNERQAFVQSIKCCRNYLHDGHSMSSCRSKWRCRFCKERHHSLIHDEPPSEQGCAQNSINSSKKDGAGTFIGFGSTPHVSTSTILLGTVQGYVVGKENRLIPVRAILDSGSQHSFITLATEVGAGLHTFKGSIIGLGASPVSSPSGYVNCTIRPIYTEDHFTTEALVVEKISPAIPSVSLPGELRSKLSQIRLADKHFHKPGDIDMLIGMDLYPLIVTGAPYKAGVSELFLQPTVFGSVVIGRVNVTAPSSGITLLSESHCSIETQLKAFWELEEPKLADMKDPEHQLCEEHFVQTHTRTPDGRYMVRLPLGPGIEKLGRNREAAIKSFLNLESRFSSDATYAVAYRNFIKEYEELQHLSPATIESPYIIPHHGMWQQSPSRNARKLRVVFDASCSSKSQTSLNSFLLAGSKLQADICEVLINFRLFRFPLCADIVKMYRQILIHPDDRHLQHIIWRDDPSETLQEFQLNTVTYGIKSSAYQAHRVIQQLLTDECDEFPLAKRVVSTCMYVDDIVAGADSVEETRELQLQLINRFAKGGFTLSKWTSTIPELIPNDEKMQPLQIKQQDSNSIKILDLVWNPSNDSFSYAVIPPPVDGVTKRVILSHIARIFDPLGMLAPVTFAAKVILQDVWKLRLGWDEPISPELGTIWKDLAKDWRVMSMLTIRRHVSSRPDSGQMIGFCDASKKGYAAALYWRTQDSDGNIRINLIKAATKVAPLNYTSISRLELCCALLLARLVASINISIMKRLPPLCFSDSLVVLSWLQMPNHQLNVFEANRTSQIIEIIPIESWRHVYSHENPCDIASRGCMPSQLQLTHQLWWHGPSWLVQPLSDWPKKLVPVRHSYETSSPVCLSSVKQTTEPEFVTRFSDFFRLIRAVARAMRFLAVIRGPRKRITGPVSSEEFQAAKLRCVRQDQGGMSLKELAPLSPFIDELGIIRVGGRLHEAPLSWTAKHPILLPRKHYLSKILARSIHERNYHAGATLTLAILRNEFWITGALKLIRSIINSCVHCRIRNAKPLTPIMASLPKDRLSGVRAFHEVGLDYAGPFLIKTSSRRQSPVTKAYLCFFICMSTKAIHLEPVSSLETYSFLAALDRFVSRRGIPRTLWSDHGTNFVGAARFIKNLYSFLYKHEEELVQWLAPKNVQWKFIPPRAPHFGGLWEAGVKSVKKLMAGTIGSQAYTFEELSTVFTRIEGILNSMPLCALNEDVENCDYLTPAHFLIGSPVTSLPEACDGPRVKTPLARWERVQAHLRSIWDRWRGEYLHTLQQRGKWTGRKPNINVGDLVIMIEHRSLIGHWPITRVIDTRTGRDGVVRTVTIRTPSDKTFVRAVATLAPLLNPDYDSKDNP